ncbi:hypothetical protein, partial [Mycobacterium paraffinicum]|uniref:hypothetical protein n=1 Tax=Mycobacterium paraffinicum TaxID=53378 RepID=UPI0031E54151
QPTPPGQANSDVTYPCSRPLKQRHYAMTIARDIDLRAVLAERLTTTTHPDVLRGLLHDQSVGRR